MIAGKDSGLSVKTTEFSGFLRVLKEKLGDKTDMKTIVNYEMGRVLNRALALTGKADEAKIEARWKNAKALRVGGINGRLVWMTNKKTGRPQRFPDATWNMLQSVRATSLERALAKVGAAKASWAAAARKLGQKITVPAYVENVVIKNGVDRFATVDKSEGALNYGVTVLNNMRILNRAPEGRQALFAAFAGRVGFYRQNMARGVFDSIDKIAAKYKGVIVRKS